MIIDCISDLHGDFPNSEGGDLLIIAGDLVAQSSEEHYFDFCRWIRQQNYKKKIVIGGNHDTWLDGGVSYPLMREMEKSFTYLFDSTAIFEEFNIWGSPWIKTFPGINHLCKAFTKESDEQLAKKWDLIPTNTQILITHSPPYGFLDYVWDESIHGYIHCGSKSLLHKVLELRPRLHVFGHLHEGAGTIWISETRDEVESIELVNAAHMTEDYVPLHGFTRVEI